ncbi:MAG: hypothetical protein V1818_00680 [Candidatus Aenigmatarchaeota archaeon]
MKHKKENLVVLKYATNECYTNVVKVDKVDPKDFSIDLEKGTWSFDEWKNNKIGSMRSLYGNPLAVQKEHMV